MAKQTPMEAFASKVQALCIEAGIDLPESCTAAQLRACKREAQAVLRRTKIIDSTDDLHDRYVREALIARGVKMAAIKREVRSRTRKDDARAKLDDQIALENAKLGLSPEDRLLLGLDKPEAESDASEATSEANETAADVARA